MLTPEQLREVVYGNVLHNEVCGAAFSGDTFTVTFRHKPGLKRWCFGKHEWELLQGLLLELEAIRAQVETKP